jgi:hypothetical protein
MAEWSFRVRDDHLDTIFVSNNPKIKPVVAIDPRLPYIVRATVFIGSYTFNNPISIGGRLLRNL